MFKTISYILLFMILSTSSVMSQMQQSTNLPGAGAESLKILSWNIYMLPYISLFNRNADRARVIADKLQYSDCQIIVFQEAFSSKCRNILAKRLAKAYPFQYGPANKCMLPFRTSSGLWVLSKIPLNQLDKIQFSISKGYDAIARKGAVLFDGDFHGAKFQLLATHLQADNADHIRENQCAEIKEHLLNQYYNSSTPQIICGDFNIDMDDHANYTQMLHILEANNGEITGDTKFTYDEIDNTLVKNALGKKKVIDYILVRNDQFIHQIERTVKTFYEKIGQRPSNLSDHYAMEAVINFNPSLSLNAVLASTAK
jgi:endonuclease/exonuclease/phosphatase family metal-dependent hydrolase